MLKSSGSSCLISGPKVKVECSFCARHGNRPCSQPQHDRTRTYETPAGRETPHNTKVHSRRYKAWGQRCPHSLKRERAGNYHTMPYQLALQLSTCAEAVWRLDTPRQRRAARCRHFKPIAAAMNDQPAKELIVHNQHAAPQRHHV